MLIRNTSCGTKCFVMLYMLCRAVFCICVVYMYTSDSMHLSVLGILSQSSCLGWGGESG